MIAGAASFNVFADGSINNASVTAYSTETNGVNAAFFVYLDSTPSTPPACAATAYTMKRFAVNVDTTIGKAQMTTVLAAQASGLRIDIGGMGVCTAWSDAETIRWVKAH